MTSQQVQDVKEQLKSAVEEVTELHRQHYGSSDFEIWKNKVMRLIETGYGKDSAELKRFVNAPGKAFIVRTESGLQEEYDRKLECYETAINSLIV